MGDPVDGVVKERGRRHHQPQSADRRDRGVRTEIEVLSKAKELPLPVFGEPDYPEDVRLKYRFLDLRRETLHANIMTRTARSSPRCANA
jgi:aspartyl-tRNA synthetase